MAHGTEWFIYLESVSIESSLCVFHGSLLAGLFLKLSLNLLQETDSSQLDTPPPSLSLGGLGHSVLLLFPTSTSSLYYHLPLSDTLVTVCQFSS